ncbi:hypothetical protein PR048_011719 [Dryococelus australis]|uniref:Uncharacterized protein n=1 Tax=Dryococelus australis TaxID=614101 RepID=A0ABQ9HMF8_9NEOP|nr:hypothetical protein PR048_011719 [Dryococelus australis]
MTPGHIGVARGDGGRRGWGYGDLGNLLHLRIQSATSCLSAEKLTIVDRVVSNPRTRRSGEEWRWGVGRGEDEHEVKIDDSDFDVSVDEDDYNFLNVVINNSTSFVATSDMKKKSKDVKNARYIFPEDPNELANRLRSLIDREKRGDLAHIFVVPLVAWTQTAKLSSMEAYRHVGCSPEKDSATAAATDRPKPLLLPLYEDAVQSGPKRSRWARGLFRKFTRKMFTVYPCCVKPGITLHMELPSCTTKQSAHSRSISSHAAIPSRSHVLGDAEVVMVVVARHALPATWRSQAYPHLSIQSSSVLLHHFFVLYSRRSPYEHYGDFRPYLDDHSTDFHEMIHWNISTNVMLNGRVVDQKIMANVSGFVPQLDLMVDSLSVEEHMEFMIKQLPARAESIARETWKDPHLGKIVKLFQSGRSLVRFGFKAPELNYTLAANCFLFKHRIVVPPTLQQLILNDLHAAHVKTTCNPGMDKWIPGTILTHLGDLHYEIYYFGKCFKRHVDHIRTRRAEESLHQPAPTVQRNVQKNNVQSPHEEYISTLMRIPQKAHLKMDRRVRKLQSKRRILSLIMDLGLGKCSHTRLSALSGGEKKRLSLAVQLSDKRQHCIHLKLTYAGKFKEYKHHYRRLPSRVFFVLGVRPLKIRWSSGNTILRVISSCISSMNVSFSLAFVGGDDNFETPKTSDRFPVNTSHFLGKQEGGLVAVRLACSPSNMANRVQSLAGNRARRCRWSAGFLEDLPFPPPFHTGATPYSPQSPSSALKTSLLRAAKLSSRTLSLTILLASSLLNSIPREEGADQHLETSSDSEWNGTRVIARNLWYSGKLVEIEKLVEAPNTTCRRIVDKLSARYLYCRQLSLKCQKKAIDNSLMSFLSQIASRYDKDKGQARHLNDSQPSQARYRNDIQPLQARNRNDTNNRRPGIVATSSRRKPGIITTSSRCRPDTVGQQLATCPYCIGLILEYDIGPISAGRSLLASYYRPYSGPYFPYLLRSP